jgi:hypothetical protein
MTIVTVCGSQSRRDDRVRVREDVAATLQYEIGRCCDADSANVSCFISDGGEGTEE